MNVMRRYAMLISTTILCLLFLKLTLNYSIRFKEVEHSYESGTSANLIRGSKFAGAISSIENIEEDDAIFLAQQIDEKIDKAVKLSRLSDLNKRVWQLSSTIIERDGSAGLKRRLKKSEELLGQDDEYQKVKNQELTARTMPSDTTIRGTGIITVKVHTLTDNNVSENCHGVLVRLSENYVDSISKNIIQRTLAWARTDSAGRVVFDKLDVDRSYSVLPIAKGYEYGSSKGTTKGTLVASMNNAVDSLVYQFEQQEHRIRMFDAKTLAQIKEKHILTVRSPKEYKSILLRYLILFFGIWWVFYLLWQRRHKGSDCSPIAILMFLTGLCVLSMFSINDPLEDALFGVDMAIGVILGVLVMGLVQYVDFCKFYQNRFRIGFDIPFECISWFFKPYRHKVSYLTRVLSNKKRGFLTKFAALIGIGICVPFLILDLVGITKLNERVARFLNILPKGSGYLISALLLTILLFFSKSDGSEVGGMSVNLVLFGRRFQPSEITKYLIIFFMAAFFSVNANKIMQYSKRGNIGLLSSKLKMLSAIIIGLGALVAMYFVLGDMGPALVLAFTFIILYSIVKSKVDLENLDERSQNKKILTCDLAMLTYGVVSYVACLYIGNILGNMFIFSVIWFSVWIGFCIVRKQLFESAILFNFIISAFIFGGAAVSGLSQKLNNTNLLVGVAAKLESTAERLDTRVEMSTNTWGTLPINGQTAVAGVNTQVADGLWGLASGGLFGQGLGNGSPNYIPAFHTDMILESIGEQLGFAGIFIILLLLAILLRKSILIGYRTSHPFVFYLCLGISIVTAIQFIIISLGSTGMIPLTGITVPFLSYGGVSMVLNLAAFGILLSFATPEEHLSTVNNVSKKNIGQYNYAVSILSWLYCGVMFFICSVFFYYQFIDRSATLIKPIYVNNVDGAPVVEYNPRIAQVANKMWAGDIYDRNGILLATSDKSKLDRYKSKYDSLGVGYSATESDRRYYPFGEHLAFIIGRNNEITTSAGYAAEYRHLSDLRGYDNKMYATRNGERIELKVDLSSDKYKPNKFIKPELVTIKDLQLLDYSALIPYLKAGYNSSRVERMNSREEPFWNIGKIKPNDLQLTIDAQLQTKIQRELIDYVTHSNIPYIKNNKLLRISVVVLNAENGDLLASANYPMVDYNRLDTLPVKFVYDDYRDYTADNNWTAFVDRDLGLTLPTAPGSTAKIMSSIAGLRKLGGNRIKSIQYFDNSNENRKEVKDRKTGKIIIQEGVVGSEDRTYLKDQMVSMEKAVVWSSNNYFIKLVNENDLYDDLAYLYGQVGVRISERIQGRLRMVQSYGMIYPEKLETDSLYTYLRRQSTNAVSTYERYKEMRKEKGVSWIHPLLDHSAWQWAYGQGTLDATPLTIARVVSIVGNAGKMPKTRYLRTDDKPDVVPIIDKSDADELLRYMGIEAIEHMSDVAFKKTDGVSGKTGTAQRTFGNGKMKDGWYACIIKDCPVSKSGMVNLTGDFVETKPTIETSTLAVVVRIERIGRGSSADAKGLVRNRLLNILKPSNKNR